MGYWYEDTTKSKTTSTLHIYIGDHVLLSGVVVRVSGELVNGEELLVGRRCKF